MTNQEFLEMFQQSSSRLWETTVQEILQEDTRYQETVQQEAAAEQQYLKLDLTAEQRRIIDELLLYKERSSIRYADASYLAGIKNAIQLHRALKL